MSYWLAMRRIIIPQSARVAFPPLGSEFIAVLKGTSLASVIGVTELMRDAQLVAAATFKNLAAYPVEILDDVYIGAHVPFGEVGSGAVEETMGDGMNFRVLKREMRARRHDLMECRGDGIHTAMSRHLDNQLAV
jgi:hypothetical protein